MDVNGHPVVHFSLKVSNNLCSHFTQTVFSQWCTMAASRNSFRLAGTNKLGSCQNSTIVQDRVHVGNRDSTPSRSSRSVVGSDVKDHSLMRSSGSCCQSSRQANDFIQYNAAACAPIPTLQVSAWTLAFIFHGYDFHLQQMLWIGPTTAAVFCYQSLICLRTELLPVAFVNKTKMLFSTSRGMLILK